MKIAYMDEMGAFVGMENGVVFYGPTENEMVEFAPGGREFAEDETRIMEFAEKNCA